MSGKACCRNRRKAVVDGVEHAHADGKISNDAGGGQAEIGQHDAERDLVHARENFFRLVGILHMEERQPARPQGRQHQQSQTDEADTPDPAEKKKRHRRMPRCMLSSPVSAVAPVDVTPDMASKKAVA